MRQLTLGDIGEFRGGFAAREGLVRDYLPGRWRALQATDFAPDGSVSWTKLRWVQADGNPAKYMVAEGDILIPLRSQAVMARAVLDVPIGVVAVGPWALLTPDRSIADSAYLSWYLNHPATKLRLSRM